MPGQHESAQNERVIQETIRDYAIRDSVIVLYRCSNCGCRMNFRIPPTLDAIHGAERCVHCEREFSSSDHEWILQQAHSLHTTGQRLQ